MSGMANEGQGEDLGAQGPEETIDSQDTGTSINPAWNPVLEALPKEFHSQVTPHFSEWDQNYQKGIQKVHSQYEAWKPFVENGYDPSQVDFGLQVLQAIETQPKEVLAALKAYIGEEEEHVNTAEQGQLESQQEGNGLPDITQHPEFQRVQGLAESMAQLILTQRQEQSQSEADQELDDELSELSEKFGEFDEEWVLTKYANNEDMTLEQAVQAYGEFVNSVRSGLRQPGPKVLGSGGSVPNQGLSPKGLDRGQTKNLVVQMLEQARQNQ